MVKRYKQFSDLVVSDFETEEWQHPLHNHNHFEIIYVAHGSGMHNLNKRLIPYKEGHLYLLGPEDEHEFIIQETTRFIYFKFTNFYLDTDDVDNPSNWNRDVDMLLKSSERKKGNILNHQFDRDLVLSILNIVVEEYNRNALLSKKIIFQFFKALILILKRNRIKSGGTNSTNSATNTVENLLEYIEMNIYEPELLTKKRIAERVNLSPNYVGIYFKNKVGTPLKKYIQEYRYSLLLHRIRNGQNSTKQLANDFKFTDESHLHKFVKSQSGESFVELKNKLDAETPMVVS